MRKLGNQVDEADRPRNLTLFLGVLMAITLVSGCGTNSETEELLDRIEELESQIETLEAATTTLSQTTTSAAPTTSMATTTTSTTSTTTTRPSTTTTTVPPTNSVSGLVQTYWFIDSQIVGDTRPTCDSISGEYTVEIRDGGDRILAIASLSNTTFLTESEDELGYTIECQYNYRADVPQEPVYSIVLSNRRSDLKKHNINATGLPNGTPAFYIFFSCITGVGCETDVYSQ